jgi:hypothetical protein
MKMMKGLVAAALILAGGFLCAQESEAYIREFTGTVDVKVGTAAWRAARTGERIAKDTVISTSFKSTALIALGNSTLIVKPLTRLTLAEIQNMQGDESVDLYLHTGRVRAEVNPPVSGKTNFTMRSPTTTASVRGTSFDFDGVNLSVDEGRVYITGGDGTGTYVGAGHRSVSDPGTGRTTGAGEMVRSELTPAVPPAAAMTMPGPAAIMPGPGLTMPGAGINLPDGSVDMDLVITF